MIALVIAPVIACRVRAECLPHQVQMPEDQMIAPPLAPPAIAPYPAHAYHPSRPVHGGPAVAPRPEKLSAGTGRCSYSAGYLGTNLGTNLGAWEDVSAELLLAPPRVLRPKVRRLHAEDPPCMQVCSPKRGGPALHASAHHSAEDLPCMQMLTTALSTRAAACAASEAVRGASEAREPFDGGGGGALSWLNPAAPRLGRRVLTTAPSSPHRCALV